MFAYERMRTRRMRTMAEQPLSSAITTDCDDVVKIPKSQYKQAVAQMSQQRFQLVAASNLHRLMREKEEELMASKEENQQLQLALQQRETHLSNIIRLQAATAATSLHAATHALEADCASENFLDVETDGETGTQPQQCFPLFSSFTKPTEKLPNKSVTLDSVAVTQVPVTLISSTSLTLPSAAVSSALTDTCATHETCLASSVTAQMSPVLSLMSATNPESKDLLDKVLQQNARLKKTLRDFLSKKGLSVSSYLDRQEYEDAAEILRHDLADAQKRINQLRSIIASRNNGDIDRVTQECARLTDKVAILERKLAISQAYTDALKQAHDKCRQGVSYEETNGESALAVSSADYAKVLEELQKVKDHCKACEIKNETLQSELEASQLQLKQLQASEGTLSELDNLKHEHQQLLEERQLNQSQIATYEEDFKIEQKEKQELQKNYELNIAKHQEWIRRLAAEAQKCRVSWEEEIAKKKELENQLRSIQSGHMSPSELIGSKCNLLASQKLMSPLTGIVGEDGSPDASVENDSEKRRTGSLVCPRCEREFPCTEKSRWELHCKRCTDD